MFFSMNHCDDVISSISYDITYCPICNNKLKNKKLSLGKQKMCVGIGHFISIKIIKKKVTHVILYFNNYSCLEIDYNNKKSTYYYDQFDPLNKLDIPRIMELDFPKLEKLKEKLLTYMIFT